MKRIVLLTTPPTVTDPISKEVMPAPGYVSLGGGYYDVADNVVLVNQNDVVSEGPKRYTNLPAAHKPKVLLTEVFKSTDKANPDLRARILAFVKTEVEAQGKTLSDFTPAQIKRFILKKFKDRIAANQAVNFTKVRMKMSDTVSATDIEDTDTQNIIPHRWLGEPPTEDDPPVTPPPNL